MSISSTNPSHGMSYAPLNQNEAGSASSTSSNAPQHNVNSGDIASTSLPGGTQRAQPQTLEEALLEMEQSSQARLAEMRQDAEARANAPVFIRDSRAQLPDMDRIIRNIDNRAAAQQRARVAPQPRRLGHMQAFLEESLMGGNRGLVASPSSSGLSFGSSSHGLASSSSNRNVEGRPLDSNSSSLDIGNRLREMVVTHFERNSASGLAVIDGREGISQHTQPPEYGFEAPISDVRSRATAARGEELMRRQAEAALAEIERIPARPVPMTGNEPTWNRLDDDVLPRVRMSGTGIVSRLMNDQRKSIQECKPNPFEALDPGIANHAPAFEAALDNKPELQALFVGHDYAHLSNHVKDAEGLYTQFKAGFDRSGTVKTALLSGGAVIGDVMLTGGMFTAASLAGPAVVGVAAANGAALGQSVNHAIKSGKREKALRLLKQMVVEQKASLSAVNPGSNSVHHEALVSILGREGAEELDSCRHELRSDLHAYFDALGNLSRSLLDTHEAPFSNVKIPLKGESLVASHYRFQSLLEELTNRVRR